MHFFFYVFFSFCLASGAAAQELELGALLPLTGPAAATGQAAETALRASVQNLLRSGVDARVNVLDSRGDPEYAASQARELLRAGVHALVCCETAELLGRLGPLAEAANVPTFVLTQGGVTSSWLFPLGSGDTEALVRLALEPALAPLALIAPTGSAGDGAEAVLTAVAAASAGSVRYPAGRTPLTPEALAAATLEPRGVAIWDSAAGSLEAAAALTARGFTGTTIVRAAVWDELSALERASLTGAVSVVSPAVLGYTLPDAHPSKGAASSLRRALGGLSAAQTGEAVTVAAAAWDAGLLLGAAAEQVLTYADPADTGTAGLRSALRGSLVGLRPVVGAGGSYDFTEDAAGTVGGGVLAESLVLAARRGGGFGPLP